MRKTLPLILLVAACAPRATTTPVPAPVPAAVESYRMADPIHWVRNSAEYRALTLQTYRAATARIRELAAGRAPGSWAVVLDGDETVIDNSAYQARIDSLGQRFAPESWYAWARERAAAEVPGAGAFLREVARLGGRVAIVTNRDEAICEDTRANIVQLNIPVDLVLCRQPGQSDKNPRFRGVAEGTVGLPPAEVLLFVGDNIQDFPELRQDARGLAGALDLFGDRYFMLPNPMYGSWESLARR